MDLHQQCHYCLKTYSYISTYITHRHRNHEETTVCVSAEQLRDDGFVMKHDSIVLLFIHEPPCALFHNPSEDDSSETEADS
jgi:hypothetical protein